MSSRLRGLDPRHYFPPVDVLMQLAAEAIAEYMILYLNLARNHQLSNKFTFLGTFNENEPEFKAYIGDYRRVASLRLAEAWDYLYHQGFLARDPEEHSGNWFFVTQRGQRVSRKEDFAGFPHVRLLPKDSLDPKLAEGAWPLFVSGDFETAIFRAFKEVEVRIRAAANLPNSLLGTGLARKAFDVDNGPLTDASLDRGERQAQSDLFAGALGSFKNPSSHRDVNYDKPATAASLILFANMLLELVDARTPAHAS